MNPVDAPVKEETAFLNFPNIPLSAGEKRIIKFFPGATLADWEDWRWQIRNRIRTFEQISKFMALPPNEEKGVKGAGD